MKAFATASAKPTARASGCGGIVLGKALLDGKLDLGEALAEATPC